MLLQQTQVIKNLEILLQQINVRKGNVFQLDQRILKEMGIPETFSEYDIPF